MLKRTDPRVRKRCREVHGDDWYAVDKRKRQDEAIAYLAATSPASPVAMGESALRAAVVASATDYTIAALRPIANASMRKCYDALKGRLHDGSERAFLFHGTSSDVATKIAKDGFNRSYCGKHGTVFGKGVYFARDIRYSLQATYSPTDAKGMQHVIAARVLVGNAALGDSTMLEPPSGHDSTVNSTTDPSIFVVYKDYQALPEFELVLKKA